MAGGEGSRLRPLTINRPKPMVPIVHKPCLGHILDLLKRHGIEDSFVTLQYLASVIQDSYGDGGAMGMRLRYSIEENPLGTGGSVRQLARMLDGTFLVISGDALTDIDLTAMAATHAQAGGIATLAVKQVDDTREFGVVLHDRDGRVTGFQEKPDPEEALSDLGNWGIYMFEPAVFDYFPERPFVDWARDVFPALLAGDVPFYIHELREYWNDIGSLSELRRGTFDALRGELRLQVEGQEVRPEVTVADGRAPRADADIEGPAWIGRDVHIGAGARLMGPVVLGDGARVGDGAQLRECIVFPGTEVAAESIVIGAIAGQGDILANLRRRGARAGS